MKKNNHYLILFLYVCLILPASVFAQQPRYSVGVANFQAGLSMAAQLNPILEWVGARAGVTLEMKTGLNFDETQQQLVRGRYDFFIGYPAFQPALRSRFGYRVIAKLQGSTSAAIVVQADSPYQKLADIQGQELVMARRGVFLSNVLPSAVLAKQNIQVVPRHMSNQTSLVTEFKLKRIMIAAVNWTVFSTLMQNMSEQYRVLWRSNEVLNYPLLVQDAVPVAVAERVRQAFIDMANDEAGRAILAQVNQRSGIKWLGWDKASDVNYALAIESYRQLAPQAQQD